MGARGTVVGALPLAPLERLEGVDEGGHGEVVLAMEALHVIVDGATRANGETRRAGAFCGHGTGPSHRGRLRGDGGEVRGVHLYRLEFLERRWRNSGGSINSKGG